MTSGISICIETSKSKTPRTYGIAGSFPAGVIGQFIGWYKAGQRAGFIASVIVAILILVIYGKIKDKTSS